MTQRKDEIVYLNNIRPLFAFLLVLLISASCFAGNGQTNFDPLQNNYSTRPPGRPADIAITIGCPPSYSSFRASRLRNAIQKASRCWLTTAERGKNFVPAACEFEDAPGVYLRDLEEPNYSAMRIDGIDVLLGRKATETEKIKLLKSELKMFYADINCAPKDQVDDLEERHSFDKKIITPEPVK